MIGEAYFEVAHNPEKPFYVKTPGLIVKVLGTHFNVISFPKEAEQEVSLYEGKVELMDDFNAKNNVVINQGEQACYNREEGQFYVKKVELAQSGHRVEPPSRRRFRDGSKKWSGRLWPSPPRRAGSGNGLYR